MTGNFLPLDTAYAYRLATLSSFSAISTFQFIVETVLSVSENTAVWLWAASRSHETCTATGNHDE